MSHPPVIPADLAEVIATHRALFGGFVMQADAEKDADQQDAPEKPEDKDDFKSPESKQAVLADLRKERTERQALAAKVAELEPLKDQLARLQQVFGGKPDDKEGDGEDAIAAITKRLDESDRRADVERLARVNGITDDGDVALLLGVADKTQREALAKRLAPAEGETATRRLPKPDPSQGRGGSGGAATSVEAGKSLYRDKHKSTTN